MVLTSTSAPINKLSRTPADALMDFSCWPRARQPIKANINLTFTFGMNHSRWLCCKIERKTSRPSLHASASHSQHQTVASVWRQPISVDIIVHISRALTRRPCNTGTASAERRRRAAAWLRSAPSWFLDPPCPAGTRSLLSRSAGHWGGYHGPMGTRTWSTSTNNKPLQLQHIYTALCVCVCVMGQLHWACLNFSKFVTCFCHVYLFI